MYTITVAQSLFKRLWENVLQTKLYLKNKSPGSDFQTLFERLNQKKPFLDHLEVVESKIWVPISKDKARRRLDLRWWLEIFLRYDGTNQFCVYDLILCKVRIVWDIWVDESAVSWYTLGWTEEDNSEFNNIFAEKENIAENTGTYYKDIVELVRDKLINLPEIAIL